MNNDKLKLKSSQWSNEQSGKLLKQFRSAKTERARARMIPQLEAMKGRLKYHLIELGGLMNDELDDYDRGF